jgi:alkylation response protein AidB-like acyl-CoA dehydrogenase
MYATDGSAMLVALMPEADATMPAVTVPRDVLEQALKVAGRRIDALEVTAAAVAVGDITFPFNAVEGALDADRLERTVPATYSGELAQFNPALLAKCADAFEKLCQRGASVSLAHNGSGPGLMTCGKYPQAFIVIMPWREEAGSLPDWYTGREQAAA